MGEYPGISDFTEARTVTDSCDGLVWIETSTSDSRLSALFSMTDRIADRAAEALPDSPWPARAPLWEAASTTDRA